MTTTNNKGRDSGKSATPRKTTKNDSKQKRSRLQDMSLAAQRLFVLNSLRKSGKHTYWLRAKGCSHPAARVMELISLGYQIISYRVTAVDSDGYMHRGVAMYELVGEPDTRDLFSNLEVA
ncbi:helix-turn-helix domain-containing protein [Caballeronia sordidicola]|nr:helix-turn-helix domain-containing protein [Caballeronia sordidicola]